jgi:hypothetical protein
MSKRGLLEMLGGGDRRSIGRVDAVVALVRGDRRRLGELFGGMWAGDRVVRMRAADAVEKLSRQDASLLRGRGAKIVALLRVAKEPEMLWHLVALVPRLKLSAAERKRAVEALRRCLESRSSIVKTFAMQALADLAREDAEMRGEVVEILQEALRGGTAAMKARSRKLLAEFETGTAVRGRIRGGSKASLSSVRRT